MPYYRNTYRTNSELSQNNSDQQTHRDQNLNSEKTKIKNWITTTLFVAILLIIGLAAALALVLTSDPLKDQGNHHSKCDSNDCLLTAAEILQSLNEEINPCENFYEFACGKHHKSKIAPAMQISTTFGDYLATRIHKFREELENDTTTLESKMLNIAKLYYKSCLNEDVLETEELDTLTKLLDSYDGWPLVVGSDWNTNHTYESVMTLNKHFGFSTDTLLKLSIRRDMRNSSLISIYIEPPANILPLSLLSEDLQESNLEYIFDIALTLGASNSSITKLELENLLNIETEIARINEKFIQFSPLNISENLKIFTLTELNDSIKSIMWEDYIKDMLSLDSISPNEELIVTCPEYFEFFENFVKNTSEREILNFVIWRVILEAQLYLPKAFDQKKTILNGDGRLRNYTSRKDLCAAMVLKDLPYAQDSLIPDRSTLKAHQFEPEELIDSLKKGFRDAFQNTSWMEAETLEVMKLKIDNLKYQVGVEDVTIKKYYKKLEIPPSNSSYLDIYKHISIYKRKKLISLMKKKNFNAEIFSKGNIPTPIYSEIDNFIYFPLESTEMLYRRGRPNYIHFGRLGFITSFLLYQIIDSKGMEYDENGIIRKWWTNSSVKALTEKLDCNFHDELDKDKMKSTDIKWKLFSILEGLKHAYTSYEKWELKTTLEAPLVGLQYNPRQLIWLSFAQLMCSGGGKVDAEREAFGELGAKQFVNVPLKRSKQFSIDWRCKEDEHMMYQEKCEDNDFENLQVHQHHA